jgi:hypothetical protein
MGEPGKFSGKDKAYYDDLIKKVKGNARGNPVTSIVNGATERKINIGQNKQAIKTIVGLIGVSLLFIGVFSPIINAPIVGNRNFFQNGEGDGVIILVLAAVSLLLILSKHFKLLWLPGLISFGFMIFTFIHIKWRIHHIIDDANEKLAGNPFRPVVDVAFQSIQIQWGWAVLVAGSVFVLLAAALKEN